MKSRITCLSILLALTATQASSEEFRLLSSWDNTYPGRRIVVESLVKNVEAATNGRIKFLVRGPETVPPFEQLQPVSSGVFQLLFTVGAYHAGTTPVLLALEALSGGTDAIRKSGILVFVDDHYRQHGLKVLAIPKSAEGGFHIILREPVGPSGDLQGRKIRGNPTFAPIIKMLGGGMVILPASAIYTSLERGVVDGAAFPAAAALDLRLYEVAKYQLRPAFGYITHAILMNLNAWNKLSDEDRRLLITETRKVEDLYLEESGRLAREEEKALIAKRMALTWMGEPQRAKLQEAWENGLWEFSASKDPKVVEELRRFARSKNLSN